MAKNHKTLVFIKSYRPAASCRRPPKLWVGGLEGFGLFESTLVLSRKSSVLSFGVGGLEGFGLFESTLVLSRKSSVVSPES